MLGPGGKGCRRCLDESIRAATSRVILYVLALEDGKVCLVELQNEQVQGSAIHRTHAGGVPRAVAGLLAGEVVENSLAVAAPLEQAFLPFLLLFRQVGPHLGVAVLAEDV